MEGGSVAEREAKAAKESMSATGGQDGRQRGVEYTKRKKKKKKQNVWREKK